MNPCEAIPFNYMGNLTQWAKSHCMPLSGTFELTPFCNFQCVMCYVRLTKEQADQQGKMLRAADWIAIAKQAKEMGMLNLCLTGGEPLTHPDFWEIYSELNKMGFLISILSNGYLIDEEVIAKFKKYGAPFCMKLTLYGASDESYQRTCHCKDGFTRVSKATELLREANIPFKMTSTIVKENADDLQKIYRFARERNIPMQHTISVLKSSRGATNTAAESRLTVCDYSEELTLDVLEKNKYPDLTSPFAWCGSYRSSFWMTWNGHLQLCSFMSRPIVPYSGDFAADWAGLNEKLRKLHSPKECEACAWQSFCQRCPGILCAESGNPESVDPGLCDAARRLCELYMAKQNEEVSRNEKEIYPTGKSALCDQSRGEDCKLRD